MIGLIDTATIYARTPATGRYTTVTKSGLRCRLAHVRGGDSQQSRAELAQIRNLIWEPGYVMPDRAQVEVNGLRWNPVPATFGNYRGPSGASTYRRCDVIRAT